MFYPYNYGFIPKTRDTNGDALDIFVIDDDECSIQPLSLLEANPIGVLLTEDEDGNDSKIIAIPTTETDLTNSTFTI
jgi:inorganic pyrophosphatase